MVSATLGKRWSPDQRTPILLHNQLLVLITAPYTRLALSFLGLLERIGNKLKKVPYINRE